jgi:ADP-heptose:LPS heptosyltransferase
VRHLPTLFKLLRHLRRHPYDLVIDPCLGSGSGRALMMAARAPYKLGFVRENTHGSISCGVAVPVAPAHIAQLPVYLLRTALGEGFEAHRCPSLDIRLTASEVSCGAARLERMLGRHADAGPTIGLFCAATGNKAFDEAWWLALVEQLARGRVRALSRSSRRTAHPC